MIDQTRNTFSTFIIWIAILLNACVEAEWPARKSQLKTVAPQRISFWPPGMNYFPVGDSVILQVFGIQRGYLCASIQEIGLTLSAIDTNAIYTVKSSVLTPSDATCPLDVKGLDTTLRINASLTPDRILYLKSGLINDSIRLVMAKIFAESLSYVRSPLGLTNLGRFIFHDTSALRKQRVLTIHPDSIIPCEVFYGAVYTQRGDTTKVRFRHLLLNSRSCQVTLQLDSVVVVLDQFQLSRPNPIF